MIDTTIADLKKPIRTVNYTDQEISDRLEQSTLIKKERDAKMISKSIEILKDFLADITILHKT